MIGEAPAALHGRSSKQIPDLDADAFLSALRGETGVPELEFDEPPTLLAYGGEARIECFALAHAPPGWDGPLVLRRIAADRDPRQVEREAAAHHALGAQGFPVPRVLAANSDPGPVGSPYLVSERLRGRALLEEVQRPDQLLAHPARVPRLIGEALFRVPALLAEVQTRLHDLDANAFRSAMTAAGVPAERLAFESRLDDVSERIEACALDGLAPGVEWLRRHARVPEREAICHGDFVFTNLFVDGRTVTGVFDWSNAVVADPGYDVAGTLARLESRIPGVPRALGWVFRSVQRRLAHGYLRGYARRRPVDPERVRYFDAFWMLSELTWSGMHVRQGSRPAAEIEARWLSPETIGFGVDRFRAATGLELTPLEPSGGA